MNDNYPAGAANDPNAPHNEPLPIVARAEVGVVLGLFVDVEVNDKDDIEHVVKSTITDRFKSKDVEVNDVIIYQHDILSKSE